MEQELLQILSGGISIEIEMRWWYLCIAEEVERMGSIVVRYLIQGMCYRPYTLECTTPVLVSDIVHCAAVRARARGWDYFFFSLCKVTKTFVLLS